MSQDRPDVLVIGAGVIGLSVAVAVLEAGLTVTVYAAEPPDRTTSAAAGALWGPHLVGTDERVERWAAVTLARFRHLAGQTGPGVTVMSGLAASAGTGRADGPPPFTNGAGEPRPCDPARLPIGYSAGWLYSAPVIDMPLYLDFLLGLVRAGGGRLEIGPPAADLAGALDRWAAPVLVNCAGIGARDLAADPVLVPVRGQVVVGANPGLSEFFVGEDADGEVTYFFPHGRTVVMGGTHQEGSFRLDPDPADAQRVLDRCAAAEPRLAAVEVLAHRVGLRPVRPAVRLAAAPAGDGRHVVHCYGHGGAGVTLSWGCARDAAAMITTLHT
jgi:D-amino-acid oxidase